MLTSSSRRVAVLATLSFMSATLVSAQSSLNFTRDDVPAAAAPRAIAAADFNGDGWLDIATAGTGRDSVGVLLNRGTGGGFRVLPDRVLGGGPFDLATGDLNRDGRPDLVVANADADAVDILIGAGNGTFPSGSRVAITGGNPRGVTVADFDGDGRLDIIVTEYTTGAWRVLYGDGNGSIARQDRFGGIVHPQGVIAADFNHDGKPDIAMASAGLNMVAIFYSPGLTQRNVTVPGAVNVLTFGDYNRDGWLDLSAVSSSNNAIYTVLGGPAGLTFKGTTATGASPRGIAAVDINEDGKLDLVTGNRAASTVSVHVGSGSGAFAGALTVPAGGESRAVALGDFDHDGAIDIATANESGSTVSVLTNTTTFAEPSFRFDVRSIGDPNSGGGSPRLAVADFDRDGRPDILSETIGGIILFYGKGGQSNIDVGSSFPPNDLAVADFNGDGALDFATGDYWNQLANIFLNRGDGTFSRAPVVPASMPVTQIAAGDLNRDGHTDLVLELYNNSPQHFLLRVLLGRGDGTFAAAAGPDTDIATAWRLIVVDMDRDGRPDIVGGGPNPSGFTIWSGKGDGTPVRTAFFDLPLDAYDITLGDLNEDGRLDVIAVGNPGNVQVRLADGTGGFGPVTQYRATLKGANTFVFKIGAGDMNLDGHVDIITNEADILYGAGDGTLALSPQSAFEGYGESPIVADINLDGLPDMLVTQTGGYIAFVNSRDHTNHPPTVSAGPDRTVNYTSTFEDFSIDGSGFDADAHELRYEWRNESGQLISTEPSMFPGHLRPGRYTFTLSASDARGGQAADSMILTVTPYEEIVFHTNVFDTTAGAWILQQDPTAADGSSLRHPNANAPKVNAPLAAPANYVEAWFFTDPTQAYKLWLRLKADNNSWANDSVYVQFDGATDKNGNPIYQIGTTSALTVNLEECSGCGVSGWGWEDDGWGAKNLTSGIVLRFPNGSGRVRIQTREDGVAVDQVVLSAKKYLTTRPGAAKNDATILPDTVLIVD